MNQRVIDRIREVAALPGMRGDPHYFGRRDFAIELLGMLDAEPALQPEYTLREALILQIAGTLRATWQQQHLTCIAEARALLAAFDASREVKP